MSRAVTVGITALLAALVAGGAVVWYIAWNEPEIEPVIEDVVEPDPTPRVERIGTSVEGRDIDVYTFPGGPEHVLFVGGIHGGYEWNSVILAYTAVDYFTNNPDRIPEHVTVSIIPSLNPDGVYEVVGVEGRFRVADVPANVPTAPGRFNARDVDLNRNFDCKWQPESTWRGNVVSAGTSAFSEPEAQALRDYVRETQPDAVVFWHSASDAVYASECENGILPDTLAVMGAYADAASYPSVESFDHYEITGDAEGWLASIGIPAITVELATHEDVEWERNKKGIEALLDYYQE